MKTSLAPHSLLANAAARPWLAPGNNVQFVPKDTVFEVYE